jgi:putative sterol carrier protein
LPQLVASGAVPREDANMKYLSKEWVNAGKERVAGHPLFLSRTRGVRASILCIVHEHPAHADEVFYIDFDDGIIKELYAGQKAAFDERGIAPDFTVEGEYDTYVAIQRGEITQAQALLKGRLKLHGGVFRALRHMRALEAVTEILRGVPTEY